MAASGRHQLPHELESVGAILRANRTSPDPLELDRLKQRALARSISRGGKPRSLRAHIATALTVVGLVAGSGGALAVANSDSGSGGGAAFAQYCKKDKDHGKCEKKPHKKDRKCDDKKKKDRDKRKHHAVCEKHPTRKDKHGDH
jgi:hypothetical protein